MLVNMSLTIDKVDDEQGIKPSYSREAVSSNVQFVYQICEKLLGGEDAVIYHNHENKCMEKDVEIVPFSFFMRRWQSR